MPHPCIPITSSQTKNPWFAPQFINFVLNIYPVQPSYQRCCHIRGLSLVETDLLQVKKQTETFSLLTSVFVPESPLNREVGSRLKWISRSLGVYYHQVILGFSLQICQLGYRVLLWVACGVQSFASRDLMSLSFLS